MIKCKIIAIYDTASLYLVLIWKLYWLLNCTCSWINCLVGLSSLWIFLM